MGGTSVARPRRRSTPPHPQYRQCPQPAPQKICVNLWLKQKKRSGNFRNAFSLGDNPVRLHLAHGSARIITDAGACRFTASLLTRFLVITIIAKLLQQAFLIHNLLQALESTLDRLALLQSELDHACHLLSSPVSRH